MAEHLTWWKVSDCGLPNEGERLHTRVEGRYVTVFRHKGKLSAIDSVCHHAGGPLTVGPISDIEELGVTVVSCPWHHFLVSIEDGRKAFQAVDVSSGVPVVSGWKIGKVVQRAHSVREDSSGVSVVRFHFLLLSMVLNHFLQSIVVNAEPCVADADASNDRCGRQFTLHPCTPSLVEESLGIQ